MNTPKQPTDKSKKWEEFIKELRPKSDRVVAILGASYLKSHLGRMLESFFIDDKEISEMLLEEEGPLGSFSARIKATYALGLISPYEYHDLCIINSIQKEFLKEITGVKFTSDVIRIQCFHLKLPREILLPGETQTPRRLFVFVNAFLTQQFTLRTVQAVREKRTPRDSFMLVDMK